ncbi:MAG: RNA 2',3'-cyclic phosphodiesterase [Dehalococcoidia bacterium]|jgi:2'-5' RNA ligase|nr:MAG: RNA 2',3'-cyclic phosphodiesterase [Dehalococcoidia bacterium]
MEQIRAFIAVELPESFRKELKDLQARLRAGDPPPAKWVNPEGTHLTLSFLGSVAADRIPAITGAMSKAATAVTPFVLRMGHPGAFPSASRARVLWVGLEGDLDKLLELKTRLDAELAPLGFKPEEREFTPHLTLARLRERISSLEGERLATLISVNSLKNPSEMKVNHLSLMRSFLSREGATYRCLSQALLEG